MERARYRAAARAAGVRRRRPRWLDAALVLALAIALIVALPRLAAGVGGGFEQLVAALQTSNPLGQGKGAIELPSGGAGATVGAAPVVDGVPQFTREPQFQLAGRIPSYAIQEGRTLQIILNGAVITRGPVDPSGAFKAALELKEGANAISVTLLTEQDVVATSSYTITLDRTPPKVTVLLPQPGAIVEAHNVVVQGTTEPGSTVSVNGHTVVVSPEGAFADFLTASVGPLPITVVSADRAGNETTEKLTVVAQQSAQVVGPTLAVALDRTTARPGQQVVATVSLRDASGARVGTLVTLSVGVVNIGSAVTDFSGSARIGFAAPTTEGDIGVVVLGGGASGRATLTVAR